MCWCIFLKCSKTRLQATLIPKFSRVWYPWTTFRNGEGQNGERKGGRLLHGCWGDGRPGLGDDRLITWPPRAEAFSRPNAQPVTTQLYKAQCVCVVSSVCPVYFSFLAIRHHPLWSRAQSQSLSCWLWPWTSCSLHTYCLCHQAVQFGNSSVGWEVNRHTMRRHTGPVSTVVWLEISCPSSSPTSMGHATRERLWLCRL